MRHVVCGGRLTARRGRSDRRKINVCARIRRTMLDFGLLSQLLQNIPQTECLREHGKRYAEDSGNKEQRVLEFADQAKKLLEGNGISAAGDKHDRQNHQEHYEKNAQQLLFAVHDLWLFVHLLNYRFLVCVIGKAGRN